MFHDRATYSRISRIDERALPIVLGNTEYSFDELLDIEYSVLIRQRNLQLPMIEINKTKNNLNSSFMENFFVEKRSTSNLRNTGLMVPEANTTAQKIETIRHIRSKLWQSLPSEVKESRNLPVFRKRIKNWKTGKCNCGLCETFIINLGYI